MNARIILAVFAIAIGAAIPASQAEARGWAWFVSNIKSGPHCAGKPTTMYGDGHHNADGSRFNPSGLSAATYDYPFGTILNVTNCANGKSVQVVVKDRGPAPYQRSLGIRLDLSHGAARAIALGQNGRFESGYTSWSVVSMGAGGTTRTVSASRHHRYQMDANGNPGPRHKHQRYMQVAGQSYDRLTAH